MTPPFSNAAIRNYTAVFYDSAYLVKSSWDALLESSSADDIVIDVQRWMNRVSLDSIGVAAFSHDFESLKGKRPELTEIFDSFGTTSPSKLSTAIFMLATIFPILTNNKDLGNQQRLVHLMKWFVSYITMWS